MNSLATVSVISGSNLERSSESLYSVTHQAIPVSMPAQVVEASDVHFFVAQNSGPRATSDGPIAIAHVLESPAHQFTIFNVDRLNFVPPHAGRTSRRHQNSCPEHSANIFFGP
ncbi:hypothetical protein HOH87_04300 [bacterium]|jgi:hypothetical protein|nr:hypothetical protein [bacterium]